MTRDFPAVFSRQGLGMCLGQRLVVVVPAAAVAAAALAIAAAAVVPAALAAAVVVLLAGGRAQEVLEPRAQGRLLGQACVLRVPRGLLRGRLGRAARLVLARLADRDHQRHRLQLVAELLLALLVAHDPDEVLLGHLLDEDRTRDIDAVPADRRALLCVIADARVVHQHPVHLAVGGETTVAAEDAVGDELRSPPPDDHGVGALDLLIAGATDHEHLRLGVHRRSRRASALLELARVRQRGLQREERDAGLGADLLRARAARGVLLGDLRRDHHLLGGADLVASVLRREEGAQRAQMAHPKLLHLAGLFALDAGVLLGLGRRGGVGRLGRRVGLGGLAGVFHGCSFFVCPALFIGRALVAVCISTNMFDYFFVKGLTV